MTIVVKKGMVKLKVKESKETKNFMAWIPPHSKHPASKVTVFHCKTPRYILVWLRDWHNAWHAGQGQSLVERYLKIPQIEATFACMSKAKGWQARSCGKGEDSWRGRKWTFVQSHSPRFFASMLSFENAASSYKYLKDKGWVDSFLAFADASTMWDDNRLDNSIAIDCIHKWLLGFLQCWAFQILFWFSFGPAFSVLIKPTHQISLSIWWLSSPYPYPIHYSLLISEWNK